MKIIPIFFYHEKWAVIMRKFVYSPDGVEKMGPFVGTETLFSLIIIFLSCVEKMGPFVGTETALKYSKAYSSTCREDGSLRGDGNDNISFCSKEMYTSREDGSLRGDGNVHILSSSPLLYVEKMGPFVGTETGSFVPDMMMLNLSREDGSPSWGRKPTSTFLQNLLKDVEKMGALCGDGNYSYHVSPFPTLI